MVDHPENRRLSGPHESVDWIRWVCSLVDKVRIGWCLGHKDELREIVLRGIVQGDNLGELVLERDGLHFGLLALAGV